MLRMLQGDVGSGKTLVALRAMLAAVEAGTQAALLAPTEILARQHFATLQRMLGGLPVNLAILTGRDKGRVRESTLMGLADGSINRCATPKRCCSSTTTSDRSRYATAS